MKLRNIALLVCVTTLLSASPTVTADELSDTQKQLTTLKTEKTELEKQIDTLKKEESELQTKKGIVDETNSQVRDVVKYLEETKNILTDKISKLENDIKQNQNNIDEREEYLSKTANLGKLSEASNVGEIVKNGVEVVTGTDNKLDKYKETIKKSQKELRETKKEHRKALSNYVNATSIEYREVADELTNKQNELNEKTKTLDEKEKAIKDTESKIKELEKAKTTNSPSRTSSSSSSRSGSLNSAKAPDVKFTSDEDQTLYEKTSTDNNYKAGIAMGMTEHAAKMRAFFMAKYDIKDAGGVRGDDDGTGHGHSSGMAVDFMIPIGAAKGKEMAKYMEENFSALGIYYIIYEQQFYMDTTNIYGPANTWNWMPDRGSDTQNHYDHIHVSFAY